MFVSGDRAARGTVLFVLCALLVAALMPDLHAETAARQPDGTPVRWHGQELIRIHVGAPPFTPAERAEAIERRIESVVARLAPNEAFDTEPRAVAQFAEVRCGDEIIVVVTERDAAQAKMPPLELAGIWSMVLDSGVAKQRAAELHRAEPGALLRTGVAASLTFLALALVLAGARWLHAFVRRKIGASDVPALTDSTRSRLASQVERPLQSLVTWVNAIVLIAIVTAGTQYILYLYRPTRPFALELRTWTISPLLALRDGIVAQLPNLAFLVFIVALTIGALRFLEWLLAEFEQGRIHWRGFESDLARPAAAFLRVGVVAFAVVVAFPYLPGADSPAFKGISVFLGVLVTFASGGMISNLVAGILLFYSGAFRQGEWIRFGEHYGEIVEKRLLTTTLVNVKGLRVSIPNALLLSAPVQNFSRLATEGRVLLYTTVGIGYEVPWRQVHAMLINAAARCEDILRDPAPFVLQTALGDFAVNYELNVTIDQPGRVPAILSDLHRSIQDEFNANGVQIMTPNYMGDPADAKVVPPEKWHTPAAPAGSAIATTVRVGGTPGPRIPVIDPNLKPGP